MDNNNLLLLAGAFWFLKTAFFYFWAPFAWIACACFSCLIASDKQYSGPWWLVFGFLFGPVALLAAAGLPDKSVIKVAVRRSSADPSAQRLEPAMRQ